MNSWHFGNKLSSIKRIIKVDLVSQTKQEELIADFEQLILPNEIDNAMFNDATEWYDRFISDYTMIHISGKGGRFAAVPYKHKDKLLPQIITLFNT